MSSKPLSVREYLQSLPEDRKAAVENLRKVVLQNLPKGFEETFQYGMLGYVVPHALYPKGYHADPLQPLPFLSIASQKSHIAVYHMGLYADKELLNWFTEEYERVSKTRLDMGKSCIRFKKPDQIPFQLIGMLASKITPREWIAVYEQQLKK